MKFFYITVFALLQIYGNKATEIKLLNNAKLKLVQNNKFCMKFKCPSEEKPICVKVTYKGTNKEKKETYVEMINTCELEYMKCHKGVKSTTVPMKYCHETQNKTINKEISDFTKKSRQIRNKRHAGKADDKKIEELSLRTNIGHPKQSGSGEQEGEDCPTSCPMRAMVCARCKHGVFKTFPSTCHIRAYNCQTHDEEMELVAHFPCALSGPYLDSVDVTKAFESGPFDYDLVFQHLICRSRGYIGAKKEKSNIVDKFCRKYVENYGNSSLKDYLKDSFEPKFPPINYEYSAERFLN